MEKNWNSYQITITVTNVLNPASLAKALQRALFAKQAFTKVHPEKSAGNVRRIVVSVSVIPIAISVTNCSISMIPIANALNVLRLAWAHMKIRVNYFSKKNLNNIFLKILADESLNTF